MNSTPPDHRDEPLAPAAAATALVVIYSPVWLASETMQIDHVPQTCRHVIATTSRQFRQAVRGFRDWVLIIPDAMRARRRRQFLGAVRRLYPVGTIIVTGDSPEVGAELLELALADSYFTNAATTRVRHAVINNLLRKARLFRAAAEESQAIGSLVSVDRMTGLRNHKESLALLEQEFERAERTRDSLSIILLQIDHLQEIINNHGREIAEFLLREVAGTISKTVRRSDTVGRLDGDRFLAVLPNTDGSSALVAAEKIRKQVAAIRLPLSDDINKAISAGVGTNNDISATSATRLLQLAERGLLFAVEKGGDRACCAQEHTKPQDFDVYRSHLALNDEYLPVVLLLTECDPVRENVEVLSDQLNFQLISFGDRDAFRREFHDYRPNCIIFDCSNTVHGIEFLESVLRDARANGLPTLLIIDEIFVQEYGQIIEFATDIVPESLDYLYVRRRLKALFRSQAAEVELKRVTHDLRQAQRLMSRSERLRAIGSMAAGLTKELQDSYDLVKNRLNALASFLLPESEALNIADEIRDLVCECEEQVVRLREFIAPTADGSRAPLALDDVVHQALQITRPRWRGNAGAHAVYSVSNRTPRRLIVNGKAAELREVFVHIILNALDAMPQGGELTIDGANTVDNNICITISDTGEGMSPDVVRKLYDPFFTTKQEVGTGLGMFLVQSIVKRHGGRMDVESTQGHGTTISIILPRITERAAAADASPGSEAPAPAPRSGVAQILLIDDEKIVREVYGRMLRALGYEVEVVADGPEGLEMVKWRDFHIVITDILMPNMSGWEVAKRVRMHSPATTIVIMSGWGENYSDEYLQASCVDHVLGKPVSPSELKSLIDRIMLDQRQKANKTGGVQ